MERKVQVLGNNGSGNHQISRDERKRKKRVLQNQFFQKEFHQRNKYLSNNTCKIFRAVLEIDKVGTSIKEL